MEIPLPRLSIRLIAAAPARALASSRIAAGLACCTALLLAACGGGGSSVPDLGTIQSHATAFIPVPCDRPAVPATVPAPNGPAIVMNGARVVDQPLGTPYADAGATATDPQDGDISSRIAASGIVDTTQVGDYMVHYHVVDGRGLAAVEAVRIVRVNAGTVAARTGRPVGTTDAGEGYYERLPASYGATPAQRFPLIVYVHGSGEVGTNLALVTGSATPGAPQRDLTTLIDPDQAGGAQPFVVLYPQRCADVVTAAELHAFISYALDTYDVDPDRVYLVGESAGASQILNYLETYQDQVAAVAPISGVDIATDICAFRNVPMWLFHAADDPTVPVVNSITVFESLKACSPAPTERPRFTEFADLGHVDDTATLDLSALNTGLAPYDTYTPDLYTWFLQHHRAH